LLHDAELPDVSLGEYLVPYLPGGRIFFSDQDLATKAQRHKEESQRAKSALVAAQIKSLGHRLSRNRFSSSAVFIVVAFPSFACLIDLLILSSIFRGVKYNLFCLKEETFSIIGEAVNRILNVLPDIKITSTRKLLIPETESFMVMILFQKISSGQ
jgi:hypothetical protein